VLTCKINYGIENRRGLRGWVEGSNW